MRLLIAEGETIVREGLTALLRKQPEWTVVGSVATGRQGLDLAEETQPDLCITSLALDELNGIDLAHRLRQTADTKVVLLSRMVNSRLYARGREAGVAGFVLKREPYGVLCEAIRAVARGRTFISPAVATQVKSSRHGSRQVSTDSQEELTLREREILQLLAEGELAKEIAHKLGLSVKTVEAHRRQLMGKLHLETISDLTRYALREGLIRLDNIAYPGNDPFS